MCDNSNSENDGIFPTDVFPEEAFPEDAFPSDIFPRPTKENQEEDGGLDES
jgi:hypothetical protein